MVGELPLEERPHEQMCIQVDCTYSELKGQGCHKGVYFLLCGLPSL